MAYNDLPPLGQTTKSASLPVTIASDQDVLATSAKQDTIIGHIDGIEALLTTIDADTGSIATSNAAIQTAVEILDNAISGTEMQVDVVAPLPAGTNNIGDVDILSVNGFAAHDAAIAGNPLIMGGVSSAAAPTSVTADQEAVRAWYLRNGAAATVLTAAGALIGGDATNGIDVDVTRVIPGTSATHLGKARDSAIGATDTGVAMLGVRRDTPTAETPAAGDYIVPQFSANGEAWVRTAGELADDSAFTVATTRVQPVGYLADETSTDSVDEGDAGAARMTLDRKQIVAPAPHTAGGLLIYKTLDLDESEEEVKATAGQVYSMWVTNLATSTRYIKFYNATAANVTVGTTTPVITIPIPGNATDDITGHFTAGGFGIEFTTAICIAATTGFADNDTGAPGANEVIANIFYK